MFSEIESRTENVLHHIFEDWEVQIQHNIFYIDAYNGKTHRKKVEERYKRWALIEYVTFYFSK